MFLVFAVYVARQQQDAGPDALAATAVDEATLPQTVPFRTVAGYIVIDVIPDGSEQPIAFILDSGAPTTYSSDIADRFAGEPVGSVSTRAIDGTVLEVDIVPVDGLVVGGALFNDVAGAKGFIGPDNPLSCISENGLIGASLMTNAVWQIDYDEQEITIANSVDGLDHIADAISFDFTVPYPPSPSPVILFPGGDGELAFLLDTGSNGGLTTNPADLEAVGVSVDADGPTVDLIGAGSAGTFETSVTFVGVDLDLDGTMLADYPVATTSTVAQGEGNIGNAFLESFVVTIDWPGMKVYFGPASPDGSIPSPPDPLAAGTSWDGQNVIIGSVVKGSSADEAGLAPGQIVASIDGRSYEGATRDDFCELSIADPGASGRVTSTTIVTADGERHEIGPVVGFFDTLEVDPIDG